jgi:hypothetical protein
MQNFTISFYAFYMYLTSFGLYGKIINTHTYFQKWFLEMNFIRIINY